MWKYSEELMDHFMNPRNAGELDNPDGHSEVGSPQCGDAMTLDIDVDDNDIITDIRFQTFGCAGAIASASALTEIAKGRTIESARSIKNSEVAEFLGGMPPEKYHCSVMGHEAMTEALRDYEEKRDKAAAIFKMLLSERPGDLASALEGVEVSLVHAHPSRILVEIESGDTAAICAQLSGEMTERIGSEVEVRVVS